MVILLSLFQCANAQMTTGGKGSECATQAMDDLISCLSFNNVTYDVTTDETGTVFITVLDGSPYGRIQSCLAQYNHTITDCPDATEVINNDTNKGNQQEKTPH